MLEKCRVWLAMVQGLGHTINEGGRVRQWRSPLISVPYFQFIGFAKGDHKAVIGRQFISFAFFRAFRGELLADLHIKKPGFFWKRDIDAIAVVEVACMLGNAVVGAADLDAVFIEVRYTQVLHAQGRFLRGSRRQQGHQCQHHKVLLHKKGFRGSCSPLFCCFLLPTGPAHTRRWCRTGQTRGRSAGRRTRP